MLVKTSKETTDREKSFVFLHSVFLLQGPSVARELVELCHPALQGDGGPSEEPDFLSVILGFSRALKESLGRLVTADEQHYAEKASYNAVLQQRDSLSRKLTGLIVALRRIILGSHEKPDLNRLGLEGDTAREPVPVLRQADRIVKIFAEGKLEALVGSPIFDDAPFEVKGRGDQLKAVADDLREVLQEVGDANRQTENAYLKKVEVTNAYDQLFTRAARTFEDWCRLVGRNELADRIRPSERRPGRTVQEPPEASEEASEEATEESSPEAVADPVSPEGSERATDSAESSVES